MAPQDRQLQRCAMRWSCCDAIDDETLALALDIFRGGGGVACASTQDGWPLPPLLPIIRPAASELFTHLKPRIR